MALTYVAGLVILRAPSGGFFPLVTWSMSLDTSRWSMLKSEEVVIA